MQDRAFRKAILQPEPHLQAGQPLVVGRHPLMGSLELHGLLHDALPFLEEGCGLLASAMRLRQTSVDPHPDARQGYHPLDVEARWTLCSTRWTR